jgi:hypothetical protein
MAEESASYSSRGLLNAQVIAAYRLAFGSLGLAAIVRHLINQIDRNTSIINFFSFFTIQSNLIIIAVFLVGAWALNKGRELPNWDMVRGAAAAYMITTGVVYVLLLSGLEKDLQTTIPWVNAVLHYWLPLLALVDWVIDRPARAIAFGDALVWLVYPLAWLAYSIVRGLAVDWYPYPFLDPDHLDQGWGRVALTCVVIFLAFVGLVWAMTRTSGWRLTRG